MPERTCVDGICFVLRTGCKWNALSATGICPSSTAHDRFQAWAADGYFLRFWRRAWPSATPLAASTSSWLALDGAMTKAPLAGEKTGPSPVDRSTSGTKRSTAGGGQRCAGGLIRGRGQQKRLQAARGNYPEHPRQPA
ncbi:MAG: transposase [Verrucomicrobia bacterium]|nr:transposase [Verrucomicrobiota bacterium]